MKVLFCTARLPHPPLKGDQALAYHRARYLSQLHELHLLSFIETPEESQQVNALKPFFASITLVHLPRIQSWANMALGTLNPRVPLQVSYYHSPKFALQLRHLLACHRFDLVHVFLLRMVPYLQNLNLPTLVEFIDSMELNLERRANRASGLKRWVLHKELSRIRSYEGAAVRICDAATVVSQRDAGVLGEAKVRVIPLGVDVNLYSPAGHAAENRIIFSGNMSYEPNITAVQWFMDNCYVTLRQRIPEVSFTVAGANPTKGIAKLARAPGVEVTGFVPSMVDALRRAKVAVAPMQTGSGMQFKILEAMACGLPVVTTTYGLGDIRASGGKELDVADTPSNFVDKIVRLLKAEPYRQQMGLAARQFVIHHHSWEAVGEQVNQIYSHLVQERA